MLKGTSSSTAVSSLPQRIVIPRLKAGIPRPERAAEDALDDFGDYSSDAVPCDRETLCVSSQFAGPRAVGLQAAGERGS